jgi:hypothetical protein
LVEDLNNTHNLGLPDFPKCLFLSALNSIKDSLAANMVNLGLGAEVLTAANTESVLKSEETKIVFVSPEMLKKNVTVQALLCNRTSFVIKCIGKVQDRKYFL